MCVCVSYSFAALYLFCRCQSLSDTNDLKAFPGWPLMIRFGFVLAADLLASVRVWCQVPIMMGLFIATIYKRSHACVGVLSFRIN